MSATETPGVPETASGAASGPARPLAASSPIHDPSTPEGQLGMAFKRAMVAIRKLRGRETNRPDQISYAQYGLLFGLAGLCEPSARELAEHTDLTPATVTQMLEHLEAAGLVKRTRSEQDRRVVTSALTERGQEIVAERRAHMEPRWQEALSASAPAEAAAPSVAAPIPSRTAPTTVIPAVVVTPPEELRLFDRQQV